MGEWVDGTLPCFVVLVCGGTIYVHHYALDMAGYIGALSLTHDFHMFSWYSTRRVHCTVEVSRFSALGLFDAHATCTLSLSVPTDTNNALYMSYIV